MNEKFRSFDDIVEERLADAKKSIEEIRPEERVEEAEKAEKIEIKPNGNLLVKALADMPKFVGSDMQTYGPLKTGDIISLPEKIGNLLIKRNMVEQILT